MNPIEKDPLQVRLEISNWAVLAVGLALGMIFVSVKFSLGILLGGLISIVNFHWLHRDLRAVFRQLSQKARSSLMFKYYIRFGVTAVVLYLTITQDAVDIVGLLVGLSVVVMNIILNTIMIYAKKNPVEEVK